MKTFMRPGTILISLVAIAGLFAVAVIPSKLTPNAVSISDIITQPRLGWAVIYWTTNVPTTGRVDYGTTGSYGLTSGQGEGWVSVKHRAYLTGIGEGTYHFRITSTDSKTGKSVVSPDQTVTVYPIIGVGYPVLTGCRNNLRVPEDYQHIQAALDASCFGGTVYVGPGEYREEISTGGGVSLIGAGASETTIRGPGTGLDGWGSVVELSSLVADTDRDGKYEHYIPTLSGFTITSDYVQRTGTIDNAYSGSGSTGVMVRSGPWHQLTTIKNNVFKNLDMGVMLIQYSEPAAIVNNTFIGGKDQDFGILINIGGGTPYYDYLSTLVENNAIVEYEKAGVWVICPAGCDFLQPTDFTIQYNNTWRNTRDYLFTESTTAYRPWQTLNAPVFWQNYFGTKLPTGKTQYDPTGKNGNISADPLFVNKAGGDYHEKSGSPHVDTGNPASDYSMEPVPNGSRANIGAYGNTTQATLSR